MSGQRPEVCFIVFRSARSEESTDEAYCNEMNSDEHRSVDDAATLETVDRLRAGTATTIIVADAAVAVFNVNGRLFAIEDG